MPTELKMLADRIFAEKSTSWNIKKAYVKWHPSVRMSWLNRNEMDEGLEHVYR